MYLTCVIKHPPWKTSDTKSANVYLVLLITTWLILDKQGNPTPMLAALSVTISAYIFWPKKLFDTSHVDIWYESLFGRVPIHQHTLLGLIVRITLCEFNDAMSRKNLFTLLNKKLINVSEPFQLQTSKKELH